MRGPLNLHAREQSAGTQGKNQHTYLPGNASFQIGSKGLKIFTSTIYLYHSGADFKSQNGNSKSTMKI